MLVSDAAIAERSAADPVRKLNRGVGDKCNHTLHLADSTGKACGSWAGKETPDGIRYACSCCGRFYGYEPIDDA